MSQTAGRGDRLDGEVVFEAACPLPEGYAAPEGYRHDHQVHEVDQVGLEELTHGRGSSADADIAAAGSLLGEAKHLLRRPVHEPEARPVGKVNRGGGVGAHDEHWRLEWRLGAPPPPPPVVPTITNLGTELATSHDLGADALAPHAG